MTTPAARDRIGVCVITMNRVADLVRTLDHLTTLPESPPIVVVDNGSGDDTVEVVRRHFPGVALIALGRNIGAAARNVGVARLGTEYVALCDDDSWWEPGALTRAVQLRDAHDRVGVSVARWRVGC